MKHSYKRWMAGVLALALCLGWLPQGAAAAGTTADLITRTSGSGLVSQDPADFYDLTLSVTCPICGQTVTDRESAIPWWDGVTVADPLTGAMDLPDGYVFDGWYDSQGNRWTDRAAIHMAFSTTPGGNVEVGVVVDGESEVVEVEGDTNINIGTGTVVVIPGNGGGVSDIITVPNAAAPAHSDQDSVLHGATDTTGTHTVERPADAPTGQVTLTGRWSTEQWMAQVTFDANVPEDASLIVTVPPTYKTLGKPLGEAPVPSAIPGYTFAGWYTTCHGQEVAYDASRIAYGPMTFTAKWTAQDLQTVTFDYNDGGVTQNKVVEIPWNTLGTYLEEPETPAREGYRFDGWYTADGRKWDFQRDLAKETMTLTARWTAAKKVTVRFNGSGAPIDLDPVTVYQGETVHLPGYATWYDYDFVGWRTADGTMWTEQTPVQEDMTLYAVWDPEIPDTFSYSNTKSAFRATYAIDAACLNALLRGQDAATQSSVRQLAASEWKGSCYGMSMAYCAVRSDGMDLTAVQSDADQLRELDKPVDNNDVNNFINFFHLSQMIGPAREESVNGQNKRTQQQTLQLAVETLRSINGDLAMLLFGFVNEEGIYGGHAIVVTGMTTDSAGNYVLSLWDPNAPVVFDSTLTIQKNCTAARFNGQYVTQYNNSTRFWATLSQSVYDSRGYQDYIERGTVTGYSAGETAACSMLTTDLERFTVTAADGTTATVSNGQVSGDLDLQPFYWVAGTSDLQMYLLPEDTAVTIDAGGASGTVGYQSFDAYVTVEAQGLSTVAVADGVLETACTRSTAQTITVASDALGSDWNEITISGADTGFTVETGAKQLTVDSDHQVSASIRGMALDTGLVSTARTIDADGVTVSTDGDSFAQEEAPERENPFTDVASDAYYYEPVLWAVAEGVTTGTGAHTFSPNNVCTRGQVVTFLWRAMGSPKPTITENPFTDVKPTDYFYQAVLWAYETGITTGSGAGTFSPNGPCTRGQVVTFQYRAAKGSAGAGENPFTDVASNAYYYEPVLWAVAGGITTGTSAHTFSPDSPCTRGQIVTFLYRDLAE